MKLNKKGFTIVELVIVIAVIAILTAVLIPTFSDVIEKAHESAALQEAKSKFEEIYARDYADGNLDGKEGEDPLKNAVDGCTYTAADGKIESFVYDNGSYTATYALKSGSTTEYEWKVEEATSTPATTE